MAQRKFRAWSCKVVGQVFELVEVVVQSLSFA